MANLVHKLSHVWFTLLVFTMAGLGGAANAQSQAQVDLALSGSAAAGVSTENALTREWEKLEFFPIPHATLRTPDNRPWIEFAARRQSGRTGETDSISWTTTQTCPELRNTLIWLTTLVAPRIELSGVTPNESSPAGRRPIGVPLDGLITTVWGRGTQPDHTANTQVEITSNGGLIAEFGQAAVTNLKSCWRSQ